MAESKNVADQVPGTKKNWYQRSKITTGLFALVLIFCVLLIISLFASGDTQFYSIAFLELFVGVIGIYFIIWLIIKRKMLKIYVSVIWRQLHVWENNNTSSPEPKTFKAWVSCHMVTAWSIALLLILLILNFGIRPVLPDTIIKVLIILLFVFYFILFVVYYIARGLLEKPKLEKDFTELWAVLTRK